MYHSLCVTHPSPIEDTSYIGSDPKSPHNQCGGPNVARVVTKVKGLEVSTMNVNIDERNNSTQESSKNE